MTILEKLSAVQMELKAPKGQYNDFGKYNYRSCEDIVEAAKPILAKYKVLLMLSDELVYIGNRYYVCATASFCDLESEGLLTSQAYAREDETKKGMDGSQITGSASSYARKYALNGLLAIDDTKDADATNTGEKPAPKPTPATTKKPTGIICEHCGNTVKAYGTYTAEKVAQINKKRYGAVLCAECSARIKEHETEE